MSQISSGTKSISLAIMLCLAPGQLHAAEITDKQTCNFEVDRVINLHMAKNLPADLNAQMDLIIRDLQAYCRKGAFDAARANIADADKLLKK